MEVSIPNKTWWLAGGLTVLIIGLTLVIVFFVTTIGSGENAGSNDTAWNFALILGIVLVVSGVAVLALFSLSPKR